MLKILKRAGMLCKASAIALCRLLINLIDNMQSLFPSSVIHNDYEHLDVR